MDSLTAKDEETPGLRHRKPFQRVTYSGKNETRSEFQVNPGFKIGIRFLFLSDEQLSSLAIKFEEKRYLTTEERHQLASDIGITDTQVKGTGYNSLYYTSWLINAHELMLWLWL